MATVRRYDSGSIGAVEVTPQGGLRIPSQPTRSGVFPYRQPDGSTRFEYRPPEEVFNPGSLATLRGAPVTDLHPEIDGARVAVTAANWKAFSVGHVGDSIERDGTHVSAPIVILDLGMVALVQEGKRRELSCGYSCDLELTSGTTPEGLTFDAIQRNIVYNHVALGPEGWGRAGPTASLRLDSTDAIQQEGNEMKIKLKDGREVEVGSPEHIKAIEAERDAATGRADAAEAAAKASKVDPKVIHAEAKKRAHLLNTCDRVSRIKRVKFDADAAEDMPAEDIVVRLIKLMDPEFDTNGKSQEYLEGALETMVKAFVKEEVAEGEIAPPGTEDEVQALQQPATPNMVPPPAQKMDGRDIFSARGASAAPPGTKPAADSDRFDSDKARADMIQGDANRWRKPLHFTK